MDKISFGSFPRSGNHFLEALLKKTLPDCSLVYTEHFLFPLEKEQNITVTIRNPLECVPSWITLMRDERPNRAEQVLEWYCAYYQKCKELKIFIVPFEQLVSEPLVCVSAICKINGIAEPGLGTVEFDFSTDFHSPTKDKSGYEIIVNEMKTAPSFQTAMGLFKELCVSVG
jgi:hypothetical protein